jgi:hypothetical protein
MKIKTAVIKEKIRKLLKEKESKDQKVDVKK